MPSAIAWPVAQSLSGEISLDAIGWPRRVGVGSEFLANTGQRFGGPDDRPGSTTNRETDSTQAHEGMEDATEYGLCGQADNLRKPIHRLHWRLDTARSPRFI